MGRLAPLGLHNTRFGPFRCPVARGPARTLRVPATRPTGTSPIPGPSDPGRACVAGRARSCTRRRRPRPWRCRTGRRPCRPWEACRIPRPRWRTRGRCAARHGRNGARDRPCRHARRPHDTACSGARGTGPLVSMAAAHARPAIPRADTSAADAVQPNEPLAMRTQAMPATCGRSGRPRLEPASHEAGPAARAPRRPGGDGRPAAAHAPDSRFPHDARHPAAADPGRIPALRRQPGARLVPFAMVPSSPIELEEMRNKNQFISHLMMSIVRLTFFLRA